MSAVVSVGDVIAAKYRIDRILGVGGMGMVAAATHLELDQKVALKFMLPEAMTAPTAAERFLREARACVRLRGEHVCRVLDVGRLETGTPYIVMEYMAGQDFAGLLEQRGKLSPREAVDYMLQVLEGMAEAHANGIIHRDLKPGNIFVATDTDGSPLVKVLDFGISKSTFADGATKTGDLMGSPMYMAPEQMASSKHVDARADVWALGCILYEAISGELPFTGDTLPALCVAVMTSDPVPVGQLRPEVPPPLAATIMRCLAKAPEARFDNVAALATALAPFGSPGADAAAVRVGKVLGRSSKPVLASSGFDETIAPVDSVQVLANSPVTPAITAETPVSGRVGNVSTLSAGASQIETPVRSRRSTMPLIVGGAAVALSGVVTFAILSHDRSEQPHVASSPPAVVPSDAAIAVAVVAPAPDATVKPADPKVNDARAQLRSVVTGFVRWSAAHPSAPCPTAKDLATFVAQGLKDPWAHEISITCTEQPDDQMMGAVSLGPDGVRSADDIASWTLGDDLTGLVRGPHWSGGQAAAAPSRARSSRPPAAKPGVTAATATTTTTPPPTTTTATTPTTTPGPTTATAPPPAETKSSGMTLGSNGLPIGRTSR